ncbi:arylamine N-acetyltransferase [Marinomonas sp. TI.3.20]|uniref:arylamine N-acetyltransferase family protein n=1 Tax=Marinomonas sp. TI.3.20 TaxID=3121296 RepID=UPI00311D8AD2
MDFIIKDTDMGKIEPKNWMELYFDRIGIKIQPDEVALSDLNQLMLSHIQTFPFEMLDYFLGTAPTINLDTIRRKFLVHFRGGGCSQQNALFAGVLRCLGITCRYGMARVPRADSLPSPRAHMVLFLEWQNQNLLCDVGYGIEGPLYPLKIEIGLVQKQGVHDFRIILVKEEFFALERSVRGGWKRLYLFDFRTYDLEDFEPANYFNSLSPNSIFTKSLIVSKPTLEGGILIHNRNVISLIGEYRQKETVESIDQLVNLLQSHFSLQVAKSDFLRLPDVLKRISK